MPATLCEGFYRDHESGFLQYFRTMAKKAQAHCRLSGIGKRVDNEIEIQSAIEKMKGEGKPAHLAIKRVYFT